MKTIDGTTYFTTGEVAKAMSTNRAKLIRLEKEGILTPAIADEYSRYYSAENISKLIHITQLQYLGMSYREIRECLDYSGDFALALEKLNDRVSILNKQIAMIESLMDKSGRDYTLNVCREETYFSVEREMVFEPKAVKAALDEVFEEALAEGYIVDSYIAPRFAMTEVGEPFKEGFGKEPTPLILHCPLKRGTRQKKETKIIPEKMVIETRWFEPEEYGKWFSGLLEEADRLGWKPASKFSMVFLNKNYITGADDHGKLLMQLALTVEK